MKRLAAPAALLSTLALAVPAFAHAGHVGAFAQQGAATIPGFVDVSLQGAEAIGLTVEEVAPRPLDTAFTTVGRIVPDGRRTYDVTAPAAGRVVAVLIQRGQRVQAGQPLARLQSADLGQTQFNLFEQLDADGADVASAQAAFELASANRDREQRLFKQGIAAAKDAQAAAVSAEQAQYQLEAARRKQLLDQGLLRSRLQALGYSPVDIARAIRERRASSEFTLVAPGPGVVVDRKLTLGQAVNPGDPAFEITDPSRVWAIADVYEPDLTQIHLGQTLDLSPNDAPAKMFGGKVDFIGATIDPKTRTVEVRATFPSEGGLLVPGTFANMRLVTGHTAPVLAVPATAIFSANGGKAVWVQNGDGGEYDLQSVTEGTVSGQWAAVTSGVVQGDQVVTAGDYQLTAQAIAQSHSAPDDSDAAPPAAEPPVRSAAQAAILGIPLDPWGYGLGGVLVGAVLMLTFVRYRGPAR